MENGIVHDNNILVITLFQLREKTNQVEYFMKVLNISKNILSFTHTHTHILVLSRQTILISNEENFSETLLFSFFKFQKNGLINLILFQFVLGNKIICDLQCLQGRLFTKNWIFSDNNFGVLFN